MLPARQQVARLWLRLPGVGLASGIVSVVTAAVRRRP